MKIEYTGNNSGGYFWLNTKDGERLAGAGWTVSHRWGGGATTNAEKDCGIPADAIREFEKLTGQDASAEGCHCCGPPHGFSWIGGDGKRISVEGRGILAVLFPDQKPVTLREAMELLGEAGDGPTK